MPDDYVESSELDKTRQLRFDAHDRYNSFDLRIANKQFDFEFYLERNDNPDRLNTVYVV